MSLIRLRVRIIIRYLPKENNILFINTFRCLIKFKIQSNVVKVTGLEPFNNEIVSANKAVCNNVYAGLISIMKESTFEYYNMRMALGLESA